MDYPLRLSGQLRSHLRALRKTKGITQAQLGKILGVGQVRVAEIEQNPSAVSVAQLFKILAALDTHIVLRRFRQGAVSTPGKAPKGSW